MMFNAYDDYQNSKRKERNMQRALPFFLVFLLLALMGWAGYRGYKSVKPKPVAAEPVVIPYTKLSAATISCNDGVMVTDWRYCQENRSEIGTGSNNIGSWDFSHAIHRPRKHKRKVAMLFTPDTSGFFTFGDGLITSTPAAPYIENEMRLTREADGAEVRFIQWDREGTVYGIGAKGYFCTGSFEPEQTLAITCKPKINPADITNLMEKIAPTDKQEKPKPDPDSPHFKCPEGGCPHLDLSGSNAATPACKMPADIDVCPAQMLDPKVKP